MIPSRQINGIVRDQRLHDLRPCQRAPARFIALVYPGTSILQEHQLCFCVTVLARPGICVSELFVDAYLVHSAVSHDHSNRGGLA